MGYLKTARDFYRQAAEVPDAGLCCTTNPTWSLPDLEIPETMLEMNYGCGTTVHPRDLANAPQVLYVGVGGGMELLQFAYFSRREHAILGIEPVAEMRQAAVRNLQEAARRNAWFEESFVSLRAGDALDLPVEAGTVDVVAQNCLFNIFKEADLRRALAETFRVLGPHGRFVTSDPIAPRSLPEHLKQDERLRAMCLSGAITYQRYMDLLVEAGFGTIEVRARRPYRVLDPAHFEVDHPILLESIEVAAIKDPIPEDGPCVFTGRTAIYFGDDEVFDDDHGHLLRRNMPAAVCDKTAGQLESLERPDILVTSPTWHYDGGGCC
ncbi:MAG: arsenosugar biosynthesis arsenite methyltransferase ArsM [Acidobacteriota bacterium]